MNRRCAAQVCFVLLALFAFASHADTLTTTNNEQLVGKIIETNKESVIFESKVAGRLTIPRSQIRIIQRDTGQPPVTPSPSPVPPSLTNKPSATYPFGSGDRFDWIELKSGEWLKGKIKSLQDEKLEFDSEEMDLHTFDWEDIRTLRSPRLESVRFEDKEILEGTLLINTKEVLVFSENATNAFARSNLLAIAPTGSREIDKWSMDLSVGFSFRSGNTREIDYNAHASLTRRTPSTRFGIDYLGNFGEVQGVQTENNHRLATSFDYFLSRRLFLRIPDVEYYSDPLQNIQHRLTLGASIGYDLIRTARTEWDVTIGPAWQQTWFSSVEPGVDQTASGSALVISTKLDIELTKRLDFILEYRGQITGKNQGNSTHHAKAALEFEIHKRLDLDISFVWDRVSSPEVEASGDTPSADDLRLTLGLGLKF